MKLLIKASVMALLSGYIGYVGADDTATINVGQLDEEAKAITQAFGKELKTTLQASIMAGGPVQAIRVCKTSAPAIANRLSQEQGWTVARTSHKVRNPENQADEWEQQVLAQWQQQIAQGTPVASLKTSEVMTVNGNLTYRYMSAIPTGDVCLNCHGTSISGPVNTALKDLYPKDEATGFRKGELRGAFSLEKAL